VNFETVMEEKNITFLFDNFIRPFAVSGEKSFKHWCLTLYGGSELSEIELLGGDN